MHKFYMKMLLPVLLLAGSAQLLAQSVVSGTVKDGTSQQGLAGVNIVVKGKVVGTITDTDGKYSLKVSQAPPFTLTFSFIGFHTEEKEVTDANATIDLMMNEESLLGQEVVVSASRVEESILKSPVTIEKLDIIAVKQAATPDFYDALANMKGVQVNNGSLNFTAVNTRGFATISNTRFVQWVDGMDTQAPLLNFPTGSIMGLGELDAESLELIPGAASALYGPNAFNGIMIMKSKSPFEYQGLSAQVKQGITNSNAGGSNPYGMYSIRYAKAFNNKFAFKVNFSYMKATDWTANDYKTDRLNPSSTTDLSSTPNFDGLNKYGDEAKSQRWTSFMVDASRGGRANRDHPVAHRPCCYRSGMPARLGDGTFHRETSPEKPRVTRSSPSKWIPTTWVLWTGSAQSCLPVSASQNRSRPSSPPATTMVPSTVRVASAKERELPW